MQSKREAERVHGAAAQTWQDEGTAQHSKQHLTFGCTAGSCPTPPIAASSSRPLATVRRVYCFADMHTIVRR